MLCCKLLKELGWTLSLSSLSDFFGIYYFLCWCCCCCFLRRLQPWRNYGMQLNGKKLFSLCLLTFGINIKLINVALSLDKEIKCLLIIKLELMCWCTHPHTCIIMHEYWQVVFVEGYLTKGLCQYHLLNPRRQP